MTKGEKRPRINAETYKVFQRLAIDNDTTAEIEINKALIEVLKRNENVRKGSK
jgi:hypothetical protein